MTPLPPNRYGTNVIPLGMSQAELRRGFIQLMANAYTTEAYFARLDALFIEAGFNVVLYRLLYWRRRRLAWAAQLLGDYIKFIVISLRLLRHVKDPVLRGRSKATGARPASLVAQPPHAVRLCDENGAAFSLRGNDAGLRTRHDRRGGPLGRTLLLAHHACALGPRDQDGMRRSNVLLATIRYRRPEPSLRPEDYSPTS